MDNFGRISFGQFGEDLVIEAILQTHNRIRNGVYVDVGAFHPFKYSNTAMLHSQYGWRGINIDANKMAIEEFNSARPADINLVALVGNDTRKREYVYFDHPAVNSANQEMVERQTQASSPFSEISREMMESEPLANLLELHFGFDSRLDLLSVDAEGMDLEVLISNDWNKYRPFLIAVETHGLNLDKPRDNDVYNFLIDLGYKMVATVFVTSMFIDTKASDLR